MVKVAPSILAADFSKLGLEIQDITKAGADYIHVDSMDGHFVPNITFGPNVVKSIREHTDKVIDCHLMLSEPDRYIQQYAAAGADIISVHIETCPHIHRTIQWIKECGVQAGVVLNPGTSVYQVENILSEVDMVLQMTVNPGYGGQSFISSALNNIEQLDILRKEYNYKYEIEVDGGVNEVTGKSCVERGADILVAGTYVFKETDRSIPIACLKQLAK